MISSRSMVWVLPMAFLITFPLWRIPLTAFLSPRGGYDSSFTNREDNQQTFNMEGIKVTQSQNGKTTIEVSAAQAYTGDNPDELQMKEVDAVIIDEDGEQTFVTARKGTFDKKNNILTLINEVVIVKPEDRFELYTELLIYNDETNMAHSPGKTQILGEKVEIRGRNLFYNTQTQAYDLDGKVRCKLTNFK